VHWPTRVDHDQAGVIMDRHWRRAAVLRFLKSNNKMGELLDSAATASISSLDSVVSARMGGRKTRTRAQRKKLARHLVRRYSWVDGRGW